MSLRPRIVASFVLLVSWSWAPAEPQASPPASVSFDIAASPWWVKAISLDPGGVGKGDADHGGISYLIFDRQDNVGLSAYYFHEARQITSDNGVQNGASITVSFDPTYQKLVFHSIQLSRGGIIANRLDRSQIKLFQREKDMESFLYDGAYTAQCELEDVRVGDVIAFAYTIEGANPVNSGKYTKLFYTDWRVPVHRVVTRIVYPAERKLSFLSKNRAIKPVIATTRGTTEWLSDEKNIPVRRTDADVPVDYDPNGWVQISEFESWQEVVAWAIPLYNTDAPLSPDLEIEIGKLSEISDAEQRILAALRFVQDQVRYLGIESGVGSYRPSPPSEVLRRRFGDCKDKALLLTTLLRRSGIEAAPALVGSAHRGTVADRLPSPGVFDHVIVQVTNGDKTHWLDATRANQRGPLSQVHVGDFRLALVVSPGTRALTSYAPPPASLPRRKVTENFRIPAPGGSGELDVITEYHGRSADKMRSFLNENSRQKIEKQYLQYYARRFPRIRVRQPLVYEEMPDENGCRVKEFYAIPGVWTMNAEENRYEIGFYPGDLAEEMGSPGPSQRDDPLSLNHPIKITQEVNAEMFEDWLITVKNQFVTNAFYRFSDEAKVKGRRLQFSYSYETLVDRVSPGDLATYNAGLSKLKDTLGYNISYRTSAQFAAIYKLFGQFNWPLAALLGCVLTLAILVSGLFVYVSKRPAPLPPPPQALPLREGIGGWLILLAIGHVLRPFSFLFALAMLFPTVFNREVWRLFAEPGHQEFHPYWAPVLLFELFFNALCLVFSGVLLILFFAKRAIWPRCFATFLIVWILGACVDFYVTHQITPAKTIWASGTGILIVAAAIWIPYCFVSKRVKATFRN